MSIRAGLIAFVATVLACCATAPKAQAAMGLRCSDWLNARAHAHYGERTKRFIEVNPVGAPPVPKDVADKAALLAFYVSGIVETLNGLDVWLTKWLRLRLSSFRLKPTCPRRSIKWRISAVMGCKRNYVTTTRSIS